MKRNVKVVPAILTDSATELSRMINLAGEFAPFIQVDLMDGQFVPTRSIGVEDLARERIDIGWEAHLMVTNPLSYVKPLRDAGAVRVIFHIESDDEPSSIIAQCREVEIGVGVAVNPPTSISKIDPLLPDVDSVLLMAVYPGYYGAAFIPEVMSKIAEVRSARADVEIGMDGGIKEANFLEVAGQGLDVVCVGSAIFGQPDPGASYQRLVGLACQI